MNKKVFTAVMSCVMVTIAITAVIATAVFKSPFAHRTVDYFSLAAALFLITEGLYKITRYRNEPYLPDHLVRHLRIIIGTCVFTIHIMQYIYGV